MGKSGLAKAMFVVGLVVSTLTYIFSFGVFLTDIIPQNLQYSGVNGIMYGGILLIGGILLWITSGDDDNEQ